MEPGLSELKLPTRPEDTGKLIGFVSAPPNNSFLNAVASGNIEAVKSYLSSGLSLDIKDGAENSRSAVLLASQNGRLDVLTHLVTSGFNIDNTSNHIGSTCLILASASGSISCMDYLLQSGAQIAARNQFGFNALHAAVCNSQLNAAKYLVSKGCSVFETTEGGYTILHLASSHDDLEMVKWIVSSLSQTLSIDATTSFTKTALHFAVENGLVNIAEYLISAGASLKIGTLYDGFTPLHLAAKYGRIELLKSILNCGTVSTKESNTKGETPLILACKYGHLEIVKLLLSSYGSSLAEKDIHGATSLLIACANGQFDVTEFIIQSGTFKIEMDNAGNTPLISSVIGNHPRVVNLLLQFTTSTMDDKDRSGMSAFHHACKLGWLDLLKTIKFPPRYDYAALSRQGLGGIHYAAAAGHLQVVQWLIGEKQVSPKSKDNQAFTPFLTACIKGKLEVARWMIDNGATLSEKTLSGDPALILACKSGNLDLVQMLQERKFSASDKGSKGSTCLMHAAAGGHLEIVKYIRTLGCKFKDADSEGCTALHYAILAGKVDITKYMVENGASLKDGNKMKSTPIILACAAGHLTITKYLFNKGCQLTEKNGDKMTPLHVAALNGHAETVEWLVEHGASITAVDSKGSTPSDVAAAKGHSKIVLFLTNRLHNVAEDWRARQESKQDTKGPPQNRQSIKASTLRSSGSRQMIKLTSAIATQNLFANANDVQSSSSSDCSLSSPRSPRQVNIPAEEWKNLDMIHTYSPDAAIRFKRVPITTLPISSPITKFVGITTPPKSGPSLISKPLNSPGDRASSWISSSPSAHMLASFRNSSQPNESVPAIPIIFASSTPVGMADLIHEPNSHPSLARSADTVKKPPSTFSGQDSLIVSSDSVIHRSSPLAVRNPSGGSHNTLHIDDRPAGNAQASSSSASVKSEPMASLSQELTSPNSLETPSSDSKNNKSYGRYSSYFPPSTFRSPPESPRSDTSYHTNSSAASSLDIQAMSPSSPRYTDTSIGKHLSWRIAISPSPNSPRHSAYIIGRPDVDLFGFPPSEEDPKQ